ncbi:MAG: hypothetical protein RL420_1842 [Pseudomonadota bacterium]|jgi:hypothetical protein
MGQIARVRGYGNRFARRFVLVSATHFFGDFGFAGLGLFLKLGILGR